jgi:Arc/MetJ-type ribon-helix-helix transcriptional regulator
MMVPMARLVTRIDDSTAASIDALVAEGVVTSRADAVRRGLALVIEQARRARIATAIIAGYRERPQTDEELARAEEIGVRMIDQEPW